MKQANNWIIRSSYMDGVPTHEVVHSTDLESIQQGMYYAGVVQGMSMNRNEMQRLANRLNKQNRPAPMNPWRGIRF
jgi:hypothetical protein